MTNGVILKILLWENCTLPTCGLAHFKSVYSWFKSYHLNHLRWLPLDTHYPSLSFPLKNLIYYISHNRNRIRSNILKNDFSLTILEIKSSNPNLISWPESCSINTIIGSSWCIYYQQKGTQKVRKKQKGTQKVRKKKKEPMFFFLGRNSEDSPTSFEAIDRTNMSNPKNSQEEKLN